MSLDNLQNGINTAISGAKTLLGNPVATAVGGAVLGGAVVGTALAVSSSVKKKRRKTTRKKSTKRKTRKYKYARTAGKGKDRSTKRIRMTKTGQPYIILASGKARFIKKSSARNSRRRKGGRY